MYNEYSVSLEELLPRLPSYANASATCTHSIFSMKFMTTYSYILLLVKCIVTEIVRVFFRHTQAPLYFDSVTKEDLPSAWKS